MHFNMTPKIYVIAILAIIMFSVSWNHYNYELLKRLRRSQKKHITIRKVYNAMIRILGLSLSSLSNATALAVGLHTFAKL